MRDTPTKAWVCTMCGYIHYGDQPPAECPVCGADRELFELYLETALPVVNVQENTTFRRYVVLGAGVAGVSTAEALRKADPSGQILLVYSEPGLPYYRMNLTRYLAGEISAGDLDLHPQGWYSEQRIELRSGITVTKLDLAGKYLLASEERISYDTLILACGAKPFVPPFPGTGLKHVTTLRTRGDADAILAACATLAAAGHPPRVVCIGGGILGLETAGALSCRGAHVTVLENQDWLLSRQLNAPAARLLQEYLRGLGIQVITRARTREILGSGAGSQQSVIGVALEGVDDPVPADLVIISAGVRANVQLAREAGLEVKNGVIVNECMSASHPDVFAAGDLAEFQGVLYGLWAPAQAQGAVAGANAAKKQAAFRGIPPSSTLKVLGIDLFSIGAVNDPAACLIDEEAGQNYTGFMFRDQFMTGAVLLGEAKLAARVKKAVEDRMDFGRLLAENCGVMEIKQALG